MPAASAPLWGFVLGVAFAWQSSEDLSRTGTALTSRSLVIAALFSLLVFTPANAYLLSIAPDWAFAYFVDIQALPRAIDTALALVDLASIPLGFIAGSSAAATRRVAAAARVAAAPAALGASLLIATLPRLAVEANYTQYHGRFGLHSVIGGQIGYALLWVGLIVSAGAMWTASLLRGLRAPQNLR